MAFISAPLHSSLGCFKWGNSKSPLRPSTANSRRSSPARRKEVAKTRMGPVELPKSFKSFFSDDASAMVLSPSNEPVSLTEYVSSCNRDGKTVLLGWLRHYGCTLCVKQAKDWMQLIPRMKECGDISVALIGNGPPKHAVQFAQEIEWEADLFTDPKRVTYKAFPFRSGVSSTFTLGGLVKVINSFKEGNSQDLAKIPTDPFQQGGAVLVDSMGMVQLLHVDAFAGDHIDVDRLLCSVCDVIEKKALRDVA